MDAKSRAWERLQAELKRQEQQTKARIVETIRKFPKQVPSRSPEPEAA
jgi:hypothetical protein